MQKTKKIWWWHNCHEERTSQRKIKFQHIKLTLCVYCKMLQLQSTTKYNKHVCIYARVHRKKRIYYCWKIAVCHSTTHISIVMVTKRKFRRSRIITLYTADWELISRIYNYHVSESSWHPTTIRFVRYVAYLTKRDLPRYTAYLCILCALNILNLSLHRPCKQPISYFQWSLFYNLATYLVSSSQKWFVVSICG